MLGHNLKQELAQIRARFAPLGWKIINDWSFSLSALLAYYLLISLLPMILCLFSASILTFGPNSHFLNATRNRLVQSFPQQGFIEVIDALASSISQQAIIIFIVSFIIAVFTGSRLIVGIDDVLTIIYQTRERRIISQNIHAIKILLAFILIMPLIMISSSSSAVFLEDEIVYRVISILCSAIFTFILIDLIYHYIPQRKMSWRKTWCGALIAAAGIQVLFLLFPVYVHLFMTDYVGQIGFIIVVLLLFYLFGLLLVIGAQINAYCYDHILPLPNSLGNCIHEFAGNEYTELVDENSQLNNSMTTLNTESNPSH